MHVYRLVGPKKTMEARVLRQQRRKELLVHEVADVGTRRAITGRHFLDSVFEKDPVGPISNSIGDVRQ